MSAVDAYLATVTQDQRAEFERIRRLVHEVAPGAIETTSYRMPAFKYQGKYLLAFYAFKDHLSLFPTSGPVEALAERLKGYRLSKGTIQFTLDHPLPDDLITAIVSFRLAQIAGPAKSDALSPE